MNWTAWSCEKDNEVIIATFLTAGKKKKNVAKMSNVEWEMQIFEYANGINVWGVGHASSG